MNNIILIEDDEHILQFCINALSDLNEINIYKALSAEEALEIMEHERIDGAFIDIELPGINGFELAKKIRKSDNYHILPIVFATGADKDLPETYKEYHNFDYIAKPYTERAFLQITTRLIEEIEMQKKLYYPRKERELAFRHDDGVAKIRFSDILYATTTRRKILLVTRQCDYIRSDVTLANLLIEINEKMFVQCGKSNLVNVSNIGDIKQITYKTWDIFFREEPEKRCQLSLRYHKAVEMLLKENESLVNDGVGK